jgi:hypothetical protein
MRFCDTRISGHIQDSEKKTIKSAGGYELNSQTEAPVVLAAGSETETNAFAERHRMRQRQGKTKPVKERRMSGTVADQWNS